MLEAPARHFNLMLYMLYGITEPFVPCYNFVRNRVPETMVRIAAGADVEGALAHSTKRPTKFADLVTGQQIC